MTMAEAFGDGRAKAAVLKRLLNDEAQAQPVFVDFECSCFEPGRHQDRRLAGIFGVDQANDDASLGHPVVLQTVKVGRQIFGYFRLNHCPEGLCVLCPGGFSSREDGAMFLWIPVPAQVVQIGVVQIAVVRTPTGSNCRDSSCVHGLWSAGEEQAGSARFDSGVVHLGGILW
jgi:hypothetical protein